MFIFNGHCIPGNLHKDDCSQYLKEQKKKKVLNQGSLDWVLTGQKVVLFGLGFYSDSVLWPSCSYGWLSQFNEGLFCMGHINVNMQIP